MYGLGRVLTTLAAGLAFPSIAAAQDSWTATTQTNAPTARFGHTGVWTGSRMVIWGGNGVTASALFDTGGLYDPVADSWTATSTTGAPTPRFLHTAVWTGSRMIVWGGNIGGAGTVVNTGGAYDPVSNSWTAISTTNAPVARQHHVALWTGREMLVWGGDDNAGTYLNSGGRYDPASNTWTPMALAGSPAGRDWGLSAVWTGRELIIWGGRTAAGLELSTGGRYDPELDQWLAVNSTGSPQPRAFHTAVWSGREMIVWSGSGSAGDTGDSYDPVTNSWTSLPTLNAPSAHVFSRAVWTGRSMLVAAGTSSVNPGTGAALYDPALRTWTPTSGSNQVALSHSCAVWTGREMIVWGGLSDPNFGASATAEGARYLPVTNPTDSWSTMTTTGAPTARTGPSAVWSGREMLVWGGNITFPLGPGKKYDLRTDSWSTITFANAPSDRINQTAVWTGREMIVWGGYDGGTNPSGARYDPSTDTWTTMTNTGSPSDRQYHSAVWTGREMIVWGGIGVFPAPSVNTGARYDPRTNTWTALPTLNAPSARHLHVAVWTGREMVVWGGESWFGGPTTFLNDGASYDPLTNTWSALATTGAPSARSGHQAVWTGDRMILWGGAGSTGDVATGASYFPSQGNWTTLPATTLVAREQFSAIWTGSEMILWGGTTSGYEQTGARYSPASNSWISTTLTGAPQERHSHSAVWTGSRMIVWGGTTSSGSTTNTGGIYGGDGTDPIAGIVNDGLSGDLIVQLDRTSLSANWSGFTDTESGIVRYEWALGTSPGATDIQAFVDVGTATSATASGLSLTIGTTCYATVRATNGDGRAVTATSNGVNIGMDMSADTGCAASVAANSGFPAAGVAVVLLLLLLRKR